MKFNEKNLCAFSKVPPFDLDGILHKRSDVNKTWQKRYFVLKGNLLFYFERKADKEPLGLIILEGCRIELSQDLDLSCTFEIIFGSGNRKYTLSADDQKSMEIWMKSLACSSCEYRKALVGELQSKLEKFEISQNAIGENNQEEPTHLESVPKAPPRRQNPFNRPAPPPPIAVSSTNTIVGVIGEEKTTPGNLSGNTSNSNSSEMRPSNNNSSSNSTKKDGILGNNSNNTLRYNWETFGEEPENSFAAQHGRDACSILNAHGKQYQTAAAATSNEEFSFRFVHETFKKIILDDINESRSQKQNAVKPLIQF